MLNSVFFAFNQDKNKIETGFFFDAVYLKVGIGSIKEVFLFFVANQIR